MIARLFLATTFQLIFVANASLVWSEAPRTLRIMTYNIHHGEGMDRRLDLARIAEVIRRAAPDVVALQEVDQNVARSKNVAQAAELAKMLDMNVAFGGNLKLQGGEYGNAILSRWPITKSINHPCPSKDHGEQRGVLVTEIPISDHTDLKFFATHFDHRAPEEERLASAAMVNDLFEQSVASHTTSKRRTIAIFAGDLNALPESKTLKLLTKLWVPQDQVTPTIPVTKPTEQIDYILPAREAGLIVQSTQVLNEPVASDHRPLLTVFQIPAFHPEEALQATGNQLQKPISRILFGSCIKQDQPMPIFKTMLQQPADLAVFLGDNIYADTADMDLMGAKYAKLRSNRLFSAFRAATPCLATWDDHDYGLNDGGAEFAMRDESQKVFLDFWQDPPHSKRRQRPGVYDATILGPEGQRVQILLLDTRYFRSPLKKGEPRVGGAYVPDTDPAKTMLGDAQWKWLESELQRPAELRVIATSIQCLPMDAGQEVWANFPHEQRRLFDLIAKTRAAGVVFISGDRHWAELSGITSDVPYPLYEMTSSSFNQLHPRGTPTENAHRADPRTFHKENYGVLAIAWHQPDPVVTLEIRDLEGQVQIDKQISLKELQFRE